MLLESGTTVYLKEINLLNGKQLDNSFTVQTLNLLRQLALQQQLPLPHLHQLLPLLLPPSRTFLYTQVLSLSNLYACIHLNHHCLLSTLRSLSFALVVFFLSSLFRLTLNKHCSDLSISLYRILQFMSCHVNYY
jgi:hypothetical protein